MHITDVYNNKMSQVSKNNTYENRVGADICFLGHNLFRLKSYPSFFNDKSLNRNKKQFLAEIVYVYFKLSG